MEQEKECVRIVPGLVGQPGLFPGQLPVCEIDGDLDRHAVEAVERHPNALRAPFRAGSLIGDRPVVAFCEALDDPPVVEEVGLALAAPAFGEEHPDRAIGAAGRVDRHDLRGLIHRMAGQPGEPVMVPAVVDAHQGHRGRLGASRRHRGGRTEQYRKGEQGAAARPEAPATLTHGA